MNSIIFPKINILVSFSIGIYIYLKYFYKKSSSKDETVGDQDDNFYNYVNSEELENIPSEVKCQLECSISTTLFKKCSIIPTGYSFESEYIKEWLLNGPGLGGENYKCPFTKQKVYINELRNNKNLQWAILFLKEYNKKC